MSSNFKTSAELKTDAKNILRDNWGKGILLNIVPAVYNILVASATTSAVIYLSYSASNSGEYSSNPGGSNTGGSFIAQILLAILSSGIIFTFIDWYRTKNVPEKPFKDAFVAFRKKYLAGSFIIQILNIIWVGLWTLLLIIPGIIKSFAYSQAMYIFKDAVDNNDTADNYRTYITKSRQMMDGHKSRYFVLQLSFLGWDILAWLTLGIGYIWLAPYKSATFAAFYLDLKENQNTAEIID